MKYIEAHIKGNVVLSPVDDEDYDRFSTFRWHLANGYVARREYIGDRDLVTKRYPSRYLKLHREILEISDPKIQVDHRDGNPLNNTKSNLRLCNNAQNTYNRGLHPRNTSGYKNVSFYKRAKKWRSYIMHYGKTITLGYFNTPEEAYEVYVIKAKELHGEFYHE